MTTDDTVTVPRELAERLHWLTDQSGDWGHVDLDAILNPPPEFDPGALEALHSYDGTGLEFFPDDCLRHVRRLGWEMVRSDELAALRELVDVAFSMPDDLGYCRTTNEVHCVSGDQADAIREAKEVRR